MATRGDGGPKPPKPKPTKKDEAAKYRKLAMTPDVVKFLNLATSEETVGAGGWQNRPIKNNPRLDAIRAGQMTVKDTADSVAKKNEGKKAGELSPEVRKLLQSVNRIDRDTVKHDGKKPGLAKNLLNRGIDILSRGQYTMAEGSMRALKAQQGGDNPFEALDDFAKGMVQGVTGKKKTSYSDVLQAGGITGKKATLFGLVGDIFLDPTTYGGVGLLKHAAKGDDVVKNTAKILGVLEDVAPAQRAIEGAQLGVGATKPLTRAKAAKKLREATGLIDEIAARKADDAVTAQGWVAAGKSATKAPDMAHDMLAAAKASATKAPTGMPVKQVEGQGILFTKESLSTNVPTLKKELAKMEKELSETVSEAGGFGLTKPMMRKRIQELKDEITAGGKAVPAPKGTKAAAKQADDVAPVGALDEIGQQGELFAAKSADEIKAFRKEVYDNTVAELTEASSKLLNARGYKTLGIKAGSKTLFDTGIASPKMLNATGRAILDIDPVKKSIDVFEKVFIAGAKMPFEVNQKRIEVLAAGSNRVAEIAKRINTISKSTTPESRVAIGRAIASGTPIEHLGEEAVLIKRELESLFGPQNGLPPKDFAGLEPGVEYGLGAAFQSGMKFGEVNRHIAETMKSKGFEFKSGRTWRQNFDEMLEIEPDAIKAYWHVQQAYEKALSYKALKSTVKETFGVPPVGAMEDALRKQGYRTVHDPDGWLDGVLYPPDVADGIDTMLKMLNDKLLRNNFTQTVDYATLKWKALVTVYNPSFHMRNAVGDIMVSYFDGVRTVKPYNLAAKVLFKQSEKYGDALRMGLGTASPVDLASDPARLILGANKKIDGKPLNLYRSKRTYKMPDGVTQIKKGDFVTDEQIFTLYNKYGLKQNYTHVEFEDIINSKNALGGGNNPVRKFSESREDYFRMAHFIDRMMKSSAPTLDEAAAEAAAAVRKFHFDYTDFTKSERAVLARVLPFYKWTRKAIPLMTEQLFTNPGKALVPTKIMRAMSELGGYTEDNQVLPNADAIVPKWMRDGMAIPIFQTKRGNTAYINPAGTLPFNDVLKTVGDPIGSLSSMLHPGIKAPIELKTKRTFGQGPGYPIRDKTDYLLRQFPITNTGQKIANTGNEEGLIKNPAFLNWLTGAGIQENTPERQLGELYERRMGSSAAKKKARESWKP